MKLAKRAGLAAATLRQNKDHSRSLHTAQDAHTAGKSPKYKGRRALLAKVERRSRRLAERASAIAFGRRNTKMALPLISIHEDDIPQQEQAVQKRKMEACEPTEVSSAEEEEEEFWNESSEEGRLSESESENEVDESVAEDMRKLEESFKGISQRYRLINRIGEGTFSTVYKAEQLPQPDDDEDIENDDPESQVTAIEPPNKRRKTTPSSSQATVRQWKQKPKFVALKKIYVTSSPHRILNELELLHQLRDAQQICPLLAAFRHQDQVIAVLPYFRHLDFRLYYRDFLVNDMRHYFRNLFNALAFVHHAHILHRDIKPTNFLYDHSRKHGVLVDFGLAEREGTDWQKCLCREHKETRKERFMNSYAVQVLEQSEAGHSIAYPNPKTDGRGSKRANRAGTRGFRAPEVLLKCTAQTTKIDVWSVGVILLTLLARRFPFFNSADDIDAMIETASIFGKRRMQHVALQHGSIFETNIETIGANGFSLERIILWAGCREKENQCLRAGEGQAVDLLEKLLELDYNKRFTAKQALMHEFFTAPIEDEDERAEREAQEQAEREERSEKLDRLQQ